MTDCQMREELHDFRIFLRVFARQHVIKVTISHIEISDFFSSQFIKIHKLVTLAIADSINGHVSKLHLVASKCSCFIGDDIRYLA